MAGPMTLGQYNAMMQQRADAYQNAMQARADAESSAMGNAAGLTAANTVGQIAAGTPAPAAIGTGALGLMSILGHAPAWAAAPTALASYAIGRDARDAAVMNMSPQDMAAKLGWVGDYTNAPADQVGLMAESIGYNNSLANQADAGSKAASLGLGAFGLAPAKAVADAAAWAANKLGWAAPQQALNEGYRAIGNKLGVRVALPEAPPPPPMIDQDEEGYFSDVEGPGVEVNAVAPQEAPVSLYAPDISAPSDTYGGFEASSLGGLNALMGATPGFLSDVGGFDTPGMTSVSDQGGLMTSAPTSSVGGFDAGSFNSTPSFSAADVGGPPGFGGMEGVSGFGGSGSDSGKGGGGMVICTELHRQGIMPDDIYKADQKFGLWQSEDVKLGYHLWAKPVVKLMRKSHVATWIVSLFAMPWAYHMAYLMGARKKDNLFGRMLMTTFKPVCALIGKVILSQKQIAQGV